MGIGQFRKIHDLLCYDAFADAYSGNKEIRRNPMKRIIGYTVFWIAFGMTIAFFMPNVFVSVLFIFGLLLLGYFMFCCWEKERLYFTEFFQDIFPVRIGNRKFCSVIKHNFSVFDPENIVAVDQLQRMDADKITGLQLFFQVVYVIADPLGSAVVFQKLNKTISDIPDVEDLSEI